MDNIFLEMDSIVAEDIIFQKWVSLYNNKDTRRNKALSFRKFLYFLRNNESYNMRDATPSILYGKAMEYQYKDESENKGKTAEYFINSFNIQSDETRIEQLLLDFKYWLINIRKVRGSTASNDVTNVMQFYKRLKINIDFKIKFDDVETIDRQENITDQLKHEKLLDIFNKSDLIEKCIIATGYSSGLSAVDIGNLTVDDFKSGLREITDSEGNRIKYCLIKKKRSKTRIRYTTILSNECCLLIEEYLEKRNRQPPYPSSNRMTYLQRHVFNEKNDKLFIKKAMKKPVIKLDNDGDIISYDDTKRALGGKNIVKMYARLQFDHGVKGINGGYSPLRSHAMRHHLGEVIAVAGDTVKKIAMGHKLDVTQSYGKVTDEKIINAFIAVMDSLSIAEDMRIVKFGHPDYDKMNEKLEMHERILKDVFGMTHTESMTKDEIEQWKKEMWASEEEGDS
ncbi:hypothetical protein [Methanolobus sp.]|uniref:hypothetical protein n=1 Tax=Methanolobus sp. TaxID=1874737 RepID=UPI0025DFE1A6|nr:hypothetical protein [Methanolobus sp.]